MKEKIQRINLGITKCYLLACSGGYLLIDTGYSKDYQKFLKVMANLDRDVSEIKYLLLTHHHDDHAGFAARLVEQTGCKVIVHQNAVEPLGRGESEDTMQPVNRRIALLFSLFELFHQDFKYPPLRIGDGDIVVSEEDDEFLKSIGIEGEIVYTPGHSRDSISVLMADGSAFVGDAAMNFLNFCGIKYRPIYIEDEDDVFSSWKALVERGADRIYPSHGDPFSSKELVRYREQFTG